jgi:hypothetical protein
MNVLAAALVVSLFGWTGAVRADAFAAISGNDRFTLICEGAVVVDTACRIEIGQGSPRERMAVRFTTVPTRRAYALGIGIEKAVESNRSQFRLESPDISLLRGLVLDKCHPADNSGDILQLCIPVGSSSTVVLFMRGVCDPCEFQPYILTKEAASRSSSSSIVAGNPNETIAKAGGDTWQADLMAKARRPGIIAQICVATWPRGWIAGTTVRRDSIVSSTAEEVGSTLQKQRVFEAFTAALEDFTAFVVPSGGSVKYVFVPAIEKLGSDWTEWTIPTYESEDDMLTFRLLNNQKHQKRESASSAPRARFRMGSSVDYSKAAEVYRYSPKPKNFPGCN